MEQIQPPTIMETSRLILRQAQVDDAPLIFERYHRDSNVTRYFAWRPARCIDDTIGFLHGCEARWQRGEAFPWVLIPKPDEGPIGMVELRMSGHKAELAYVLATAYWNHGYMTEAVRAVIAWALGQPSIYRVWSVCDLENAVSVRVLEKVGMLREGILRRWVINNVSTEPRDCYCYSVVK